VLTTRRYTLSASRNSKGKLCVIRYSSWLCWRRCPAVAMEARPCPPSLPLPPLPNSDTLGHRQGDGAYAIHPHRLARWSQSSRGRSSVVLRRPTPMVAFQLTLSPGDVNVVVRAANYGEQYESVAVGQNRTTATFETRSGRTDGDLHLAWSHQRQCDLSWILGLCAG